MAEKEEAIKDRNELRSYLWEACEIEHQLMIQYLYAAFTLKKFPDKTCSPAQWEYVRRWGSQVMVVARQEMEHLALANGILTAIAEDPFFARENIPVQPRYFLGQERARDHSPSLRDEGRKRKEQPVPCDIPFLFERFNLDTISRFVCAESPDYEQVAKSPYYPDWCFGTRTHPCRATSLADWAEGGALMKAAVPGGHGLRLARTHLPPAPLKAATARRGQKPGDPLHPGSIQELYDRIKRALESMPGLFVGNPAQQVFIPVEYQINVTSVTDLATAIQAIDLIVEEGEGIDAPPGFQSHFTRFHEVRSELIRLQKEDPNFDPALPVMLNPSADRISVDYTRRVLDLFNYSYATLLFVLTSLYRNFNANNTSYPFLGTALQNSAFGPFMTMVLRPIAEVLVHLRAEKGGRETAGPNFHLEPHDEQLLYPRAPQAVQLPGELVPGRQGAQAPELANIEFFLDRMSVIVEEVKALGSERRLKTHVLDDAHEAFARRQLDFVHQNAQAMANNMRRIYQVGELPQFVVQP